MHEHHRRSLSYLDVRQPQAVKVAVGGIETKLRKFREQLVRRGLPEVIVDEVIRKVDLAEYKRRQAPPGIKISPKAFGRDRRLPITNRFGR